MRPVRTQPEIIPLGSLQVLYSCDPVGRSCPPPSMLRRASGRGACLRVLGGKKGLAGFVCLAAPLPYCGSSHFTWSPCGDSIPTCRPLLISRMTTGAGVGDDRCTTGGPTNLEETVCLALRGGTIRLRTIDLPCPGLDRYPEAARLGSGDNPGDSRPRGTDGTGTGRKFRAEGHQPQASSAMEVHSVNSKRKGSAVS